MFNGLSIKQDEYYSISVDSDDKLRALEPYPIDRIKRKQMDELTNAIETSAFCSINGSIDWIVVAASPFCALVSSYLQQKLSGLKVRTIFEQINRVSFLKKMGTTIKYRRPTDEKSVSSVLLYSWMQVDLMRMDN